MPTPIIIVTEKWSGKVWNTNLKSIDVERIFDVSGTSDESQAIAAPNVNINDPHPLQPILLCKGVNIAETPGPFFFTIRASYGVPPEGIWPQDIDFNVFGLPPRVQWSEGSRSLSADYDLTNAPFVNSASDPFSSPFEETIITDILTYTRFEPFYNVALADTYRNSTNSDTFKLFNKTAAPGQAILRSMKPKNEYVATAIQIEMQYVFEFDTSGLTKNPWQTSVIDKGSNGYYSDSGTARKGQICYKNGDPVSSDVLLDGTGQPADTTLMVLDKNGAPQSPIPNPSVVGYFSTNKVSPGTVLYFKSKGSNPFSGLGLVE